MGSESVDAKTKKGGDARHWEGRGRTTVSRSINAATVPELLEGANERSLARFDPSNPEGNVPRATITVAFAVLAIIHHTLPDLHLESRSSSLTSSKRSLSNRFSPSCLCFPPPVSPPLISSNFSLLSLSLSSPLLLPLSLGLWRKEEELKKGRRKE